MAQITPLRIGLEVRAIDSFLVGDRSVVKAVLTNADKTVTIGLTGAPGLPRAYSRLIVAAPDLLHALKEAREVVQDALNTTGGQIAYNEDPHQDGGYGLLERTDYLSQKLQVIDAAIAKAEGGA